MTENEYLLIFERIFEKHYNSLKLYAMRIVGSYDVSEDILQDCFFELWQKRHSIDFSISISSYLYKIVFNRAVNYVHSKANMMQNADSISNQLNEELFSMIAEEEDHLAFQDLSAYVAKGIETLPEQCRRVFIMSRTYEMKNKEIAEKLGISVKAVEKHITQALKVLRAYLMKNEFLPFFILFLPSFLV